MLNLKFRYFRIDLIFREITMILLKLFGDRMVITWQNNREIQRKVIGLKTSLPTKSRLVIN